MLTPLNSQQVRKQGRATYLQNKFNLVDFLDKKGKFDKMLEEQE